MSDTLEGAVNTILEECFALGSDENVVVVTDPARRDIAEALVEGARSRGAESVLCEMSERANNGAEPPAAVAAAMLEGDVVIAPTTMSLSHTEARHAATKKGARIGTLPGVTMDLLVRTMNADYAYIRRTSEELARLLSEGEEVHITSDGGTDVVVGISGREALSDDGDLRSGGAFGNLPAGEGFVAPVEGTTTGRIVFDGSIWPVGLLEEPLVATIVDGYATSFEGPAAEAVEGALAPHGKEAYAVAELGIGTNPAARLTGKVLEDEKIIGTIHIAFGDNHSFGGKIRVASHQDGVVLRPRVTIDSTVVLEDGGLLV